MAQTDATVDADSAGFEPWARPQLAFVASIAAMALLPFGVTGTNLAFPAIESTFDETSRTALSWALSGYSIVIAAFTLLGGQLSDRFDAKRIFVRGLAVFGFASLVAGVAPGAWLLIVGRALQGVGGALIVPSSLILVTSQYPEAKRPFVIGVWTAAFPIGSSVAPSVTALVLELASWRWVFLLMTVVAALVAVMAAKVEVPVPEAPPAGGPRPDFVGMAAGTVAVGLLALGIVEGPTWGWISPEVLGSFAAAVVLLALFVRRSLRHPRPLMDLGLFSIPTYAISCIANVFISIAGMSVWLIWPLYMSGLWGYSAIEVGIAITPTPILGGGVAILSTRWSNRYGFRGILVLGSLVIVAANVYYALTLDTTANYVGGMLPGLILYGVGMGLTFAPVNAAALVDVPPVRYGQANAGFSTIRFLAGAMGVAGVIAALGEGGGPDPLAGFERAYTLLAVTSAVSAVMLLVVWPRRRATVPDLAPA